VIIQIQIQFFREIISNVKPNNSFKNKMIKNRWVMIHHKYDIEVEHMICTPDERIVKTSNLKNMFTITWKIIKFLIF